MSQFLETPENLVNSENLYEFLAKYICPEFHPFIEEPSFVVFTENAGEKIIGAIMEKSNHKLRMYGSPSELAENLKIFRNHPESWRFLPIERTPFHASPVIYQSLNNDPFILKSDLFVILQNIAFQKVSMILENMGGSNTMPIIDLLKVSIGQTLKTQASCAIPDGRVEFVKFNHQQVFEKIEMELQEGFMKAKELESKNVLKDLKRKNYRSIAAKLKHIDARICDEEEKRDLIRNVLPLVKAQEMQETLHVFIATLCSRYVELAISQHPEVFKCSSSLPTVRVFEDGDQRFVICHEAHDASRTTKSPGEGAWSAFRFDTCSVQEVTEKYGKNVQNIEFIRTPILRAKHRAVPIPIGYGDFGILAADMLFEFFRNLIFGQKAFQKQTSEFLQGFKEFHFFDSETKSMCLLSTEVEDQLNEAAEEALRNVEKVPAKDVRNAKKDGFTVQNLKNELAYLNLTEAFPEIQDHAEIVYSEVDKRKKEKVLRTCDLFDAIEHCQLNCILNRLPKIRKFLHNQKGCHRVYGYKCGQCEEEKQKLLEVLKTSEPTKIKQDEQQTLDAQNSSRIENLEKELAELKLLVEKTLLENKKLQFFGCQCQCNGDVPKI